jgi:hypothetical protein
MPIVVLVCPRGHWFESVGSVGGRHPSTGRVVVTNAANRRILAAIASANATEQPVKMGVSVEDASRYGWPGEKLLPKSVSDRVFTAISNLRKLGLRGVLTRREDGYVLEADRVTLDSCCAELGPHDRCPLVPREDEP